MIEGKQLFDDLWDFYRQRLSPEKVSSLDFAELVTYLLFLKIDDERGQRRLNPVRVVQQGLGWLSLAHKDGLLLAAQFRQVVQECGKRAPNQPEEIMHVIFRDAAPDLKCTPAALRSLIRDVIAVTRWSDQGQLALHEMYRLLMEEASERFQILSGQTLTPAPLASAAIECLRPNSSDVVLDPACGTGSLLVSAYESMSRDQAPLGGDAVRGTDFDPTMCRFATMSYLLRTGARFDSLPPVQVRNSLIQSETGKPTVIVCNPPFRSTAPMPEGRTDLWARSGSMQLNFLQHIARGLPAGARAAVFVPDNILFRTGAEGVVRRQLLQEYDVHTLLRLPTGVFARGGVKTNLIFFDAVRPHADGSPATSQVWIYDFRSGLHFAARQRPLRRADLDDFVNRYDYGRPRDERAVSDRFKPVNYQQLSERGFNLDILWPNETEPEEARSPKEIALEIADGLDAALQEFKELANELPDDFNGEQS